MIRRRRNFRRHPLGHGKTLLDVLDKNAFEALHRQSTVPDSLGINHEPWTADNTLAGRRPLVRITGLSVNGSAP